MSAFLGYERANSGGRMLSALRRPSKVALASDAAGRRGADDAQLRAADCVYLPAFEPDNLLAVQIYLPQSKYRTGIEFRTRFYMDTLAAPRRDSGACAPAAGVQRAADVSGRDRLRAAVSRSRGRPGRRAQRPRSRGADIRTATPGYFETMKIALRTGRFIDSRDRQGATRHRGPSTKRWRGATSPARNPIGKIVRNPHGKGEVIGVVGGTSSTTGSTANHAPSSSCPPGSSR